MIITDELKSKVAELAKRHNLCMVVLFGSQATGHTHKFSDTDMAFMSDRDIDYAELFDIENDFKQTLKIRNIELVNMRKVYPIFMKQISDNGKLLFEETSGKFISYKVHAFKMYVDTAPLRIIRNNFLNRFIEKYA